MTTQKTKPTGTRGIAYLRTSKDSQEKHRQRKVINLWCEEKGITPSEWIEDSGPRDLSHKRVGFQDMLRIVEGGKADWIVVAERDRLGFQDAWEYGHIIHTLRNAGVELWAATGDKLLTTTTDRIEPILASLEADKSQREQGGNAERVQSGKRERVERGEWTGGKPPYGYDLVARTQAGQEVYRLVHEPGLHRRLVYYPDGTTKRFDGKDNLPGRDAKVVVYVEKTLDPVVEGWVRKIFEWFCDGMSYRKIATLLNANQVPALYKSIFLGPTIKGVVSNPVYVLGVPVYNKAAHGRFQEWVDGKLADVVRVNGKAKAGRKRTAADHFHAAPNPSNAIIDQATWDKAQARIKALAEGPKAPRRPRCPELFFGGLVTCSACLQPMVAWSQQQAYRCSTNMHDSKKCLCGRTPHDILETLVRRWLKETEQQLGLLHETPGDYIAELDMRSEPLIREYSRAVGEMYAKAKAAGRQPPVNGERDQKVWTFTKLRGIYGTSSDKQAQELKGEIEKREREREKLTRRLGLVDDEEAAAVIASRIQAVTGELRGLREKARPVVDRAEQLRAQIKGLLDETRRVLEEVEVALPVRRREAVRSLVAEIRVTHKERKMGKLRASRLTAVEIIPRMGAARRFTEGLDQSDATQTLRDEGRRGRG